MVGFSQVIMQMKTHAAMRRKNVDYYNKVLEKNKHFNQARQEDQRIANKLK